MPWAGSSCWSPALNFSSLVAFEDCPFCLLFTVTPDGNTPVHPVPESCSQGLGCHGLPAGWGQDGGPSPTQGTEQEQAVTRECRDTGTPSIPALPHPRAQGWLSMPSWDGLPRELHLFLLPGFPHMLTHHGWGNSGCQVLGYEHSSCSPGGGWSLLREGIRPWAHFLLVFGSNRFRCGAGLDQTGAPTPSPGLGDSEGLTEAAGAW